MTGSNGSTVTPGSDNKYTLSSGNYTLSFKAKEDNTSSKGYCCITVFKNDDTAGTNYYTDNIVSGNPYTVKIANNETSPIKVKIEPIWGDVDSVVGSETGNRVDSNGTITIGQTTSEDGKESNNLNALTETNNTDTNKSVAAEKTQGAASEEKPTETTENTEAETNLPEETTTEKTEETTAADSTEETTETDDQADTTDGAKTTEAAETGGTDETNQ